VFPTICLTFAFSSTCTFVDQTSFGLSVFLFPFDNLHVTLIRPSLERKRRWKPSKTAVHLRKGHRCARDKWSTCGHCGTTTTSKQQSESKDHRLYHRYRMPADLCRDLHLRHTCVSGRQQRGGILPTYQRGTIE
jgi:hypothetical protein